jgi:cell division initiation protein
MLTPLDIESKSFKKGMGYSAKEVDRFLRDIVLSYEKIYKENIELKDKVNVLNEGIQYYKTIEDTLQNTLLLAEKVAEETKANAHVKAEQIEKDAELKMNSILQESRQELSKVQRKIESLLQQYENYKIQIRQYLRTQLELLENKDLDFDYELKTFDEVSATTVEDQMNTINNNLEEAETTDQEDDKN